jgi:lipopolysaccharide export system protein LptC
MTYKPAFWFPISILAVLAALSLWLQYAVKSPNGGAGDNGAHIADYIVDNLHAVQTNASGKPENTLSAGKLQHFMDDDSSLLDTPHFTTIDPKSGNVDVRSNTALVTSKGEKITFTGQVVLLRDSLDNQDPMRLTTDYLEVFPDQHLMRTNRPVAVSGAQVNFTAGGLVLNDQTRLLQLTRHVKARYAPIH